MGEGKGATLPLGQGILPCVYRERVRRTTKVRQGEGRGDEMRIVILFQKYNFNLP